MSTATKAPSYIDRAEKMLTEMRSFSNGLDRQRYMAEQYPQFPDRFWDNHMGTLIHMDAIQLEQFLTYSDKVGERATDNVMAGARR